MGGIDAMHREGCGLTGRLQANKSQVTGGLWVVGWFHRGWPRGSRGFRAEERRVE